MWHVRQVFLHQSARWRTGFSRIRCFSVDETAYLALVAMIGGGIANLAIWLRIAENKFRVTATSANWNVTCFACRVTFAPILTSFSRSVVSDRCFTSRGKASRRRKLARLYQLCQLSTVSTGVSTVNWGQTDVRR